MIKSFVIFLKILLLFNIIKYALSLKNQTYNRNICLKKENWG